MRDVATLGEALGWHGGLTLDYLFEAAHPTYIECNPRTVEPANAVASGVDLPGLQVQLSLGEHPAPTPPGRTGVRTHSALAVLLGTAAYSETRRAVAAEARRLLLRRGPYAGSQERLTPLVADPPSILPLALVATRALLSPAAATRLAERTVRRYAVTADAVAQLRAP